jgi:hypothetical protein
MNTAEKRDKRVAFDIVFSASDELAAHQTDNVGGDPCRSPNHGSAPPILALDSGSGYRTGGQRLEYR